VGVMPEVGIDGQVVHFLRISWGAEQEIHWEALVGRDELATGNNILCSSRTTGIPHHSRVASHIRPNTRGHFTDACRQHRDGAPLLLMCY
jgi:hypothetical protein